MSRSQLYPLELLDETLDINATDNYDLSLELSAVSYTHLTLPTKRIV